MGKKRLKRADPELSEMEVLPTEHSLEPVENQELIDEIKQTADKLARDQATRGDLKILSRTLRELRYAFKVFTPYRRHRKVTVFGSARTQPEHEEYKQAVKFAAKMAAEGWMSLTGAGGGIMEAGHVGAGKAMSMGVNIMLPFEQDANHIINDDEKLVHLKYFFTRKLLFVKEVHAVALFPGGFGTQDEGFETLTLVQTGKRDMMPIVFIDEPDGIYWKSWLEFVSEQLLSRELISPADMSCFSSPTTSMKLSRRFSASTASTTACGTCVISWSCVCTPNRMTPLSNGSTMSSATSWKKAASKRRACRNLKWMTSTYATSPASSSASTATT